MEFIIFTLMKKNVKLMWMPGESWDLCFYNMLSNELFQLDSCNCFDSRLMKDWYKQYGYLYDVWLNQDRSKLYDLKRPVHTDMIRYLAGVNEKLSDLRFYYWYDVDRSVKENYIWKECPLSGEKLESLGENYFYTNRLVSSVYPVCLPGNF